MVSGCLRLADSAQALDTYLRGSCPRPQRALRISLAWVPHGGSCVFPNACPQCWGMWLCGGACGLVNWGSKVNSLPPIHLTLSMTSPRLLWPIYEMVVRGPRRVPLRVGVRLLLRVEPRGRTENPRDPCPAVWRRVPVWFLKQQGLQQPLTGQGCPLPSPARSLQVLRAAVSSTHRLEHVPGSSQCLSRAGRPFCPRAPGEGLGRQCPADGPQLQHLSMFAPPRSLDLVAGVAI